MANSILTLIPNANDKRRRISEYFSGFLQNIINEKMIKLTMKVANMKLSPVLEKKICCGIIDRKKEDKIAISFLPKRVLDEKNIIKTVNIEKNMFRYTVIISLLPIVK